jgi:hypothetical protein
MYANRTAGSTALKRLMTEYRGIYNAKYAASFQSIYSLFFVSILELTLNAPEGITAGTNRNTIERDNSD